MGRLNLSIKFILTIVIIWFCPLLTQAQQSDKQNLINSFPKEKVEIIANSEVLLSGQTLAYVLSCHTDKFNANISDIIYAELISDIKTVIFKHKLRLTNGKANADFFLPTTLKTGHYKLIAYTAWTLNNEIDAFDQMDVYVINPFLNAFENNLKAEFNDTDSYSEIAINSEFAFKNDDQDNGLKIESDSEFYKKRSKISLELQNKFNETNYGTYTVLVKKIDSIEIQKHQINKSPVKKAISAAYLPEMRGELIQGKVVDAKTNLPAENQIVSLVITGKNKVYKSTKTNADGEFYFNLFETYEEEKALIQVVSENRDDYKLVITPKVFDRYNELEFYPLKLNKNLEGFITRNSIFNQVESAYYNLKRDSLMILSPAKAFYGVPDKSYVLDEFTRFNSVKETFIEVIQEAAIRSNNDGYQFLVYDYSNPFGGVFANIKPLLLLDGVQIQNENLIVDYNPGEIESVNLVRGVYSLGSATYNGIIDIKLKNPTDINLSGSYLQYLDIAKPVLEKNYFKQSYSVPQDRIPDFRTQLLWQPNIELNSSTKTIEFYTSDVAGYYMIELKGTTNKGKPIQLKEIFEVKN